MGKSEDPYYTLPRVQMIHECNISCESRYKMQSVEEVKRLLSLWDEQNESGQDVTSTLMKLAEIIEKETEVFLKKDPDPFDNRHPSRLQPDCTLGHILKIFFRNEKIVDEIVKVYCQRDVLELNIASCRLLLDILPGLETLVFEEEGFVPRLLHWAEYAPNPLQSYATGLLAAAMDSQDIAGKYKEKNAYFVPLMLRRLHALSKKFLKSEKLEGHVPERPFAGLGGNSNALEDNFKNNSRKGKKRKLDENMRYSPYPETKLKYQNSNSKVIPISLILPCSLAPPYCSPSFSSLLSSSFSMSFPLPSMAAPPIKIFKVPGKSYMPHQRKHMRHLK
ncbi:hypothetical protein TNCV_504241 [Trichonephila clavipes]|nr:hypothetical protein TNCV_504241 [Trichonephila clavipes]